MREHPGTFVAGLVFVVIGAIYLLEAFGAWEVRIVRVWPVVLIAVGATILLGARRNDEVADDDTDGITNTP